MARCVFLILLTLFTAITWGAQVYRFVDAEGNVSYSDRPQSAAAESIFIATRRASSIPSRPPPAAPVQSPEFDPAVDENGEMQRERREPTAEERAEDRAKNCTTARERADLYAVSHRLYRETPEGEREYLDDAQLIEARTQAVANVQEWCD